MIGNQSRWTREGVRFSIAGAICYIIGVVGLFVFVDLLKLSFVPTWGGLWCVVTLVSYSLNRHYTFKKTGRSHKQEIFRFFLAALLNAGIWFIALNYLHTSMDMPASLAGVIVGLGGFISNFLAHKFWSFHQNPSPEIP